MRKLVYILVATALAACNEAPPAGRPPPPPPAPGVSASLSIHDGDGGSGPFRIGDLTRLALDARYDGVEAGPHVLRIDVLSPRGTLYAQYQGSLELDGTGRIAWSRVLEVSGTPIDALHQVGTWRFQLTVDEGTPLATAEASLVE